jgi:hypothetical protein
MISMDNASIRSGTETIRGDGDGYEGGEDVVEGDDMAGMVDVDLLGGLAGGKLVHGYKKLC